MNGLPFLKIDESHPDHTAVRIDIPAAIQYLENSINDDRYTSVWNLKVTNIIRLFTECKRLGLIGITTDLSEMETDRIYSDIQTPPIELNFGYQPELNHSDVPDIQEYRDVVGADHPLFFLADYLEQFLIFAKGQVSTDFPKIEKVRAASIDSENNKGKLIDARRSLERRIIYDELTPAFKRNIADIDSRLKYLEDSSRIVEVSDVTSQQHVEVSEDIKSLDNINPTEPKKKAISKDIAPRLTNTHKALIRIYNDCGAPSRALENKEYQDFMKYFDKLARTGNPGTKIKFKNQIKRIDDVIQFLSVKGQVKAIDEVRVMVDKYESEYGERVTVKLR